MIKQAKLLTIRVVEQLRILELMQTNPKNSLTLERGQPRMGKIRVICSNGMLSAAFFFSSGWLNSLLGRTMSWPLP